MFKLQSLLILSVSVLLNFSIVGCKASGGGGGGGGGSGGSSGGIGLPSDGGGAGGGGAGGGSTGVSGGGTPTQPPEGGGGGGGNGGGAGGGNGGGGGAEPSTLEATVSGAGGRTATVFPGTIDLNGLLNLLINISNGSAFQVITEYTGAPVSTLNLFAPGIEDAVVSINDNPLKTLGVIPLSTVNTVNYPTSGADPVVVNGQYVSQIAFFGVDANNPQFTTTIVVKNDLNLNTGPLTLNVHLVGSEAQKDSTRAGISTAVDIMRTTYAQVGVSLSVSFFDVNSDFGVIPNPSLGSGFYVAQGSALGVPQLALNLYVGETISADATEIPGSSLNGVLGIASSIPGPASLTPFSAVAVSNLEHQGPDGIFSAEEIGVFGETFAHESGHYLGLFHPVESDFVTEDPLPDTVTCNSSSACLNTGTAANLMYFEAVSGIQQRVLTGDQGAVMNRNVLVN
jgi:hypothetical protein